MNQTTSEENPKEHVADNVHWLPSALLVPNPHNEIQLPVGTNIANKTLVIDANDVFLRNLLTKDCTKLPFHKVMLPMSFRSLADTDMAEQANRTRDRFGRVYRNYLPSFLIENQTSISALFTLPSDERKETTHLTESPRMVATHIRIVEEIHHLHF